MELGLDGKVAWVLGASSGLGRATAASLAAEGARVAVSSRSAERLVEAAGAIREAGGECVEVPLDVRDGAAVTEAAERVAAELGPIEILVSNAGGPPPGGFNDVEEDDLYAAFDLTTASAWRLAKAVLPSMRAAGSGVMIFLTSDSTKEIIPTLVLSNMMRAAVVGMMKTLSKELAADGIRALCVAPGRIETARLVQLDEDAAARTGRSVDEVRASLHATIPMHRYGDPKEFGDVVAFLASSRGSFVNGVSLSVNGGALNGLLS